ncbi:MAG: GNAT family N-acetyltransferase [Myxococcota bacterium]
MPPEIVVAVVPDAPDAVVEQLGAQLREFNRVRAPRLEVDGRLVALAWTRDGFVLGGGIAWSYGGWAELTDLWVAEQARGNDLGTRLMDALEAEARRLGCTGMHTDTFSFQALPFYEKRGFTVFGTLDGYVDGNVRYYLRKSLVLPGS